MPEAESSIPEQPKAEIDKWVELNTMYANQWPNITKKKDAEKNFQEMFYGDCWMMIYIKKILSDFNWKWLLQKIDKLTFEERVDQILYPTLQNMGALSSFGKLNSKRLNIASKQLQFNPDWDENIILHLLNLFGNELGWTPPELPNINHSIVGERTKISIEKVQAYGLSKFLLKYNVFSYAIPSPNIFNYTTFKKGPSTLRRK